jgi:hypothetical protein
VENASSGPFHGYAAEKQCRSIQEENGGQGHWMPVADQFAFRWLLVCRA